MRGGPGAAERRLFLAWEAARRLPAPVAFALGWLAGMAAYRLDAPRRRALHGNLRQVLGPGASSARVARAARRGFASYARYWVEAFRLQDLPRQALGERLAVEGLEHLDAAIAAGKGAILTTPHLGNWDAGGAWLAVHGYPMVTVVERLRPQALFERFLAYRQALGMEVLPLGNGSETFRRLLKALAAGKVVCLVADRDLTGGGVPVEVFGRATTMPPGPAMLSLRTGAALLPCGVFQERRPLRWRAVVRPPLAITPTGDQRKDARALTQRLAGEFEALIRQAPEQWHVMSPYWPPEGPA